MKKKLALAVVAVLAAVSAFAVGAPKIAHADSPCYYTTYTKEYYGVVHLPDTNYMNMVYKLWQVPDSGCTEWAGHHFGDTEVSYEVGLGTHADSFFQDTFFHGLTWGRGYYGNGVPTGDPPGFDSGTCPPTNSSWCAYEWIAEPYGAGYYYTAADVAGQTISNGGATLTIASTYAEEDCGGDGASSQSFAFGMSDGNSFVQIDGGTLEPMPLETWLPSVSNDTC